MATRPKEPPAGARGESRTRRVLVVANDVVGGNELLEEITRRIRRAGDAEVMIVSPALVDRPLDLLAGEVDDDIQEARRRLQVSVDALRRNGIPADGEVGEADPVLAMRDALAKFPADEVFIIAHPHERANWLEQDVVEKAQRELTIPVTYIEVEPSGDTGKPEVRDVQDLTPEGGRVAADRAQEEFDADYLPPMPPRDRAALVVGPLGCIALALLAIDCQGDIGVDFTPSDAGCIVSWVLGVFAFIVTAIHVPAILMLRSGNETRAGGLTAFMSLTVLWLIPAMVLIAAVTVILS
jgi:hypothetical protein